MSDLMEVGQLKPGMVVGLPEELRVVNGPTEAVFAGASNYEGKVYTYLRGFKQFHSGLKFVLMQPKPVELSTMWPVSKNDTLLKELREGILSGKVVVPDKSTLSGSDPEIFVLGGDGKVIPAWKFLKDKNSARSTYAPFWDGFQAEFCPTAKECLQQHMDSMHDYLKWTRELARGYDPKAKLSPQSTIEVADQVMTAASDEEVRFRCTPSLNVYRDPGNLTPEPRDYKFRFAGGHLHAGFGGFRFTTPVVAEVIKALDGILGLAGVSLAANFDTPERRKMYGRAGEFRLPVHGIEYRVLSNFWLRHPALSHLVFELFRGAIKFAESGLYATCWDRPADEEIQEIINSCDVKRARGILKANEACLVAILKQKLYSGREYLGGRRMSNDVLPFAIKTIQEGLEVAIKNPDDLEGNWQLDSQWEQLCSNKGASWASVL